ncbi:fatty acid oxidation complex subunit alpha FadB [Salinisphaera sp. Q1T1-3]|uniref:fatty acid oxidation complex subunit alpha FadB n=1 Tax=Salinisphaera sp. Q1T1-3 TaxID=2321229 RepID=UPI000E70DCE0|nr:fatty acid oxidation complex subunit alpha FadB [Salinisphaera sp. Q1T1-3]RJS93116.1 fatty acid oxidation complex subunit alpha FadB [Salinisphaera sp. Q1T1-3]
MLYEGKKLTVTVDGDIAVLCFDAAESSVNKFDEATVAELGEAAAALVASEGVQGLLVTSAKPAFIVGADIMEFGARFKLPDDEFARGMADSHAVFNAIEDLAMPSVTAINGMALGGGLEMCLSTDYRVMGEKAQIGFPETKLGIYPGFGGTVRTPRLIGADNAIEWIADGKNRDAGKALAVGMVDAVVADDRLEAAARDLLARAIAGEFDWAGRRADKTGPLKLNRTEAAMTFETAKGYVLGTTKGHYPAPIAAIDGMAQAAHLSRDEALKVETQGFIKVAKTPQAAALIQLFLNDQLIKKKGKQAGKIAHEIDQAAVLGAGIMGGGIAYQSAYKGVPTLMKDIKEDAIDQGLEEAAKHFAKGVERGKLDTQGMATGMSRIRPTLSYADFGDVDAVIEAVVENPKIKKSVLAETEGAVSESTILASNTSSISIDELATGLSRPENFLGMHFFNPVHRMPLVEVIRGKASSDEAVATIVAFAHKLGKTPIVVNDCPGFLVNRILFPYFFGFQQLIADGADFAHIDKVMEKFGWPMGPAYLSDVVGMDTSQHVEDVLAAGYPDRMKQDEKSSLDVMVENNRLGQKTGAGYYAYEKDKKGRPKKSEDPKAYELIKQVQRDKQDFEADEIIDRMMIPMIIEAARAYEEGIAETPNEVDMGLIMGLGFPPFRGGAFKYADAQGLQTVCDKADRYARLGKLYEPTERMREMAARGETYFQMS